MLGAAVSRGGPDSREPALVLGAATEIDDARKPEDAWSFAKDCLPDIALGLQIGVPIMISSMASMVQGLITSMILGREGTVLLAAVSTSTIVTDLVDEASHGGTSQIPVLCSQALGSGKKALVGVWLQMGLLTVLVLYPVLALAKVATGPILAFLGVPAILSVPAGTYALWVAPAMIFDLMYRTLTGYYYAQALVLPDMIIQIIFVPIGSLLIWVLVARYDMGLYGVAIALSIKRVGRFFAYLGYTWGSGLHKKTWNGWQPQEVFVKERWATLIALCIPAAFGSVMEILSFSLTSVFAARLGPTSSAAYDLIMQLTLVLFASILGMCQGFGVVMARRLGEGRPQAAQGMIKACTIVVGFMVIAIAFVIYFFIDDYAAWGSNDLAVRALVVSARGVVASLTLTSGFSFLLSTMMGLQSRMGTVFIHVTLCNWFIGLPVSYFLTPLYGIWGTLFGPFCSYYVVVLTLAYHFYHTDWEELVISAAKANADVTAEKQGQ